MNRVRIYMTGVGGQGTLTATTLLARTCLEQGLEVVSGEIHGMAQRGGVVESTVLVGGWQCPKIGHGEADVVLGFEPLESLRALPYLRQGGLVISNTDALPPIAVCTGAEAYPSMDYIRAQVEAKAGKSIFMPCRQIGLKAGSAQCGNIAMLAAFCATGILPFGTEALRFAIRKYLKPKIVDMNLKAVDLAEEALA